MTTEADLLEEDTRRFSQQHFIGLQLNQNTIASKEFDTCTFTRCSFLEIVLARCRFLDCLFEGCTLSAVHVPTSSFFPGVRFIRSKVIGVDWSETKASHLGAMEFIECDLTYSSFVMLKLNKLKLKACQCREVDFSEADLTDGEFEGTDFEGSTFFRTNLTNANFRNASNYRIDVRTNTIKKAKFSLPEAVSLLRCLDLVLDPD